MTIAAKDALDLLDWKRQVFALYARIRALDEPLEAWELWRAKREDLFRTHPQSPFEEQIRARAAATYFDYDPRYRVFAAVKDAAPETYEIPTSGDGTMRFSRIGSCSFELNGSPTQLEMYWLDAYAGGIFVPFRDKTSGDTTYGAGRYLLDTVKGSDLGTMDGKLVLDFNFAYNPSCAYDPRWVCPLAPPPNRLDIAIEAGERSPAP